MYTNTYIIDASVDMWWQQEMPGCANSQRIPVAPPQLSPPPPPKSPIFQPRLPLVKKTYINIDI